MQKHWSHSSHKLCQLCWWEKSWQLWDSIWFQLRHALWSICVSRHILSLQALPMELIKNDKLFSFKLGVTKLSVRLTGMACISTRLKSSENISCMQAVILFVFCLAETHTVLLEEYHNNYNDNSVSSLTLPSIFFKVRNQNWLQFGQFLSVFNICMPLWRKLSHKYEHVFKIRIRLY